MATWHQTADVRVPTATIIILPRYLKIKLNLERNILWTNVCRLDPRLIHYLFNYFCLSGVFPDFPKESSKNPPMNPEIEDPNRKVLFQLSFFSGASCQTSGACSGNSRQAFTTPHPSRFCWQERWPQLVGWVIKRCFPIQEEWVPGSFPLQWINNLKKKRTFRNVTGISHPKTQQTILLKNASMKSPQGKPGWKTPQPAQRCSGHRGTSKETPLWDPWTARLGYPGVEYNTVRLVDRRTPPVFAAVSTEVRLVVRWGGKNSGLAEEPTWELLGIQRYIHFFWRYL